MNRCILLFGMPRAWIGKLFDGHPDALSKAMP
jgi:hypothetical protein